MFLHIVIRCFANHKNGKFTKFNSEILIRCMDTFILLSILFSSFCRMCILNMITL